MEFKQQILLTLVAGTALAGLWIAMYMLVNLGRAAWNWIDDNERPVPRNPIITWLMPRLGYRIDEERLKYGSSYIWEKEGKGSSSGDIAVFMPMFLLFWAPSAIFVGLWLYPLTLAAITLFLIACVARFARRHKKLFDKHLKDPQAHK